jgi:hypothetical protein
LHPLSDIDFTDYFHSFLTISDESLYRIVKKIDESIDGADELRNIFCGDMETMGDSGCLIIEPGLELEFE